MEFVEGFHSSSLAQAGGQCDELTMRRRSVKNKVVKCCLALQILLAAIQEGNRRAGVAIKAWREELVCGNRDFQRLMFGDPELQRPIPCLRAFLNNWERLDPVSFWRTGQNYVVLDLIIPYTTEVGRLRKEIEERSKKLIAILAPLNTTREEMQEVLDEEQSPEDVGPSQGKTKSRKSFLSKLVPSKWLKPKKSRITGSKSLPNLGTTPSGVPAIQHPHSSRNIYPISRQEGRRTQDSTPLKNVDLLNALKDYIPNLDSRFKKIKRLLCTLDIYSWPLPVPPPQYYILGMNICEAFSQARLAPSVYREVIEVGKMEKEKANLKDLFEAVDKVQRECSECFSDIEEEIEVGEKLLDGILAYYGDLLHAPIGSLVSPRSEEKKVGGNVNGRRQKNLERKLHHDMERVDEDFSELKETTV